MAKLHCILSRRTDESIDIFKTRITLAIQGVNRLIAPSLRIAAGSTMTTLGLQFYPETWSEPGQQPATDVCFVASCGVDEWHVYHHFFDLNTLATVPRNPDGSRLTFDFKTIDGTHRDRFGHACEVIDIKPHVGCDVAGLTLPMLRLKFEDGLVIDAWPEEVSTANAAKAAALQTALAGVTRQHVNSTPALDLELA